MEQQVKDLRRQGKKTKREDTPPPIKAHIKKAKLNTMVRYFYNM